MCSVSSRKKDGSPRHRNEKSQSFRSKLLKLAVSQRYVGFLFELNLKMFFLRYLVFLAWKSHVRRGDTVSPVGCLRFWNNLTDFQGIIVLQVLVAVLTRLMMEDQRSKWGGKITGHG